MKKLEWQIAGDVHENTVSLEFWDEHQNHIADVVRYDNINHLKICTFGNEVDMSVLQAMMELALSELASFEDGTPLEKARPTQVIIS